jgi:2-iminobutanoate/2-iminopropanoate deaminase
VICHCSSPRYAQGGMRLAALLLTVTLTAAAVEKKPIYPAKAPKPVGPYTPGILAGNYLYVSGQGARDASNQISATFEAQAKQCLENVRSIVEAAGLKLDSVVYTQVYLADIKNYDAMNKIWNSYFPKNPPARSVAGVANMPTSTPIEISAVAITTGAVRKTTRVPAPRLASASVSTGVLVDNRFYLGGIVGRNFKTNSVPKDPRAQMDEMINRANEVLKAANLGLRHLASATVYVDGEMPMDLILKIIQDVIPSETATTIVQAASLPFGAHIEMTGVASRDLKREGHCTGIGETLYCPARAGSIQTALKYVNSDLEAARTSVSNVVASNVFIDHIDNFNAMNKVYAGVFGKTPPTRTTVQASATAPTLSLAPATGNPAPADEGPVVQLAVVAVR